MRDRTRGSGPQCAEALPAALCHHVSIGLPSLVEDRGYRRFKRLVDVIVSGLGLIILIPILVLLGLIIRLETPGPVIYRRRVVGVGGATFDALKLRSMVADAEKYLREDPKLLASFERDFKLRDDPRVTRIGKWLRELSLDELPQLVNVLRGEMSLVGPRIIAPEELVKYGSLSRELLSVKPGMTGLWQVSGRQALSYEKRVELDMSYIGNRGAWLDLKILMLTIPACISRRGAH